jgi:menaquinone-9 beta-reductase
MKAITIIGGGLAGLTLGIALRRRKVPVTIVEAGHYPRHRVCGEFISGNGLKVLEELELLGSITAVSRRMHDTSFFFGERSVGKHLLPEPALCISRYVLDRLLAETFRGLGGELREDQRWSGPPTEGAVCATGRRMQTPSNGWHWFGLKAHARNVFLEADLEMHFDRDAYVGICKLSDGEVNVCGLFRREMNSESSGDRLDRLRGPPDSRLFHRLEHAEFDKNSLCAVAGLSLRPQPISGHECRIGDALTTIPPVTGNGMSMAFESAWAATTPIIAYANGERSWLETTAGVAQSLRELFSKRLRWAARFHELIFSPIAAPTLRILLQADSVWRRAFAVTR